MPAHDERLLLLASRTKEELVAQLACDDRQLLDCDDVVRVPDTGPYRLAIVNADARQLGRARRIVEDGVPWRGRNDIWFTGSPLLAGGGKIALIFPGIEQRFEPSVEDVAAHFRLPVPALARSDHSVLQRSISLLAVGRLLDTALRLLGVTPAAVAGHSLGEWNAMMSAGLFSSAAMDELIAAIDPVAFELPDCLFAALGCGVDVAGEAIAGLENVVISHDNCPHQSIVCGDPHAIEIVVKRLEARGVLAQVLNFRSGFHSPLLAPYLDNVSAVANLPIGSASVPVWSATTAQPFPGDKEAVRDLVIRHLLEPVRFRTLIENLYASGTRAFVQAGVGTAGGFIDDTLCGRDYLCIAANVAAQPGLRQLRRTAAALWVEGARLRFDVLATASVHPVMAELEALLADATEAAQTVTARFLHDVQTRDMEQLEPRQMRYTWKLSLEDLPFVIDHALVRQPASWPVIADRNPVIPLTTTFELLRDVARQIVPERTPVALRDVSALRWFTLDAPLELEVTATFDGRESVRVDLGGYATATVVVSDRYPEGPMADTAPFANECAPPATAAQLYADRWLFHGPLFQGVERIDAFGDDGIRGTVRALESKGAVVDCAGQLMVFWIMASLPHDRYALPGGVQSVEYFGPQPQTGEITSTVRIRSVTSRTVYADFELADRHGRVFVRLRGFENRRFATDDVTWPVLLYPEINTIAQPHDGGWVLLSDRWQDAASTELIARRYLGTPERERFRTHAPRGRRHWLMGRIAGKDAVRRWLWTRGAGALFPVEIAIENNEQGGPIARVPGDQRVHVSIAHSGDFAVAFAAGHAVGIDIELVKHDDLQSLEMLALCAEERALLEQVVNDRPQSARSEIFTRFWAAKEAASKAEGTGLQGRPKAFAVTGVEDDRLRVQVEAREYIVDTRVITGNHNHKNDLYVVAWTHIQQSRERIGSTWTSRASSGT